GTDIYTGARRFTFGTPELLDGLDVVAIAVGLFGVTEVMRNLEKSNVVRGTIAKIGRIWPSRADLKRMIAPMLRGTTIGSLLGILPGGGALLSSFVAYNIEKN